MNQNQSYQSNTPAYYNCFIGSDNAIYHKDPYSGKEPVKLGVSINVYDEMREARDYYQETTQKYYDMLIEHKIIEPVKALEDINKEQAELIKKQSEMLEKIMNRLETLEKEDTKENELT